MEVPKAVLEEWHRRKKRGDISAINKSIGLSRVTITKAINQGKASADVILKISEYYSDKEITITPQELEEKALQILKKK